MGIKFAGAAACAYLGMAAAGIAIAQTSWPQLTKADLEGCRSVIHQAHAREYAFIEAQIKNYCTVGSDYYSKESCAGQRDWLAESKANDDVNWYFKGNGRCEMSDYPCFGPGLFNSRQTGDNATYWSARFAEMAAEGTAINSSMEFYDASSKSDNCLAGLWVKKYKAAGGSTAAAKTAPAPVAAPLPAAPKPAADPASITANDPTFQSNLKSFGADQLFALVDQLVKGGNVDVAKLALNALIQRFPDSQLIPVVANLVAEAPKKATPASTPPPQSAPAGTGQRLFINDGPSLIAAFARVGTVMTAVPNTQEFKDSGNLFSAWLGDCNNGRCKAVQLISQYTFTPMPTYDKVQAWNAGKLYGRAYLNNNYAKFDMLIPIPAAGIEVSELKDAIEVYKNASNGFYNSVKPQ